MSALRMTHLQAARVPLSIKDNQVLDEMFNDFDVQQIDQLEPYVKTVSMQALDPREETAWIAGSGALGHGTSDTENLAEMPVGPLCPPLSHLACPCFTTQWLAKTKAALLKSI